MKLLDLYLYANIYILFLWMFYSLFLTKSKNFRGNRIYILSAFCFSSTLPFLQNKLTSFLGTSETLSTSLQPLRIKYLSGGFTGIHQEVATSSIGIDWSLTVSLIILGGFIATLGYFLYCHIRIKALINGSKLIGEHQNKVFLCKEEIVPFIYNNTIIIPNSTPISEYGMIIRHESQHYRFGHHYDNYLLQFFQMVFWMNPFFYLLKYHLKEMHEYQVDDHIISTGTDAIQYKLALVKFRAGYQKFEIATCLNTNLKNRIKMMNSNHTKKGSWRIFLSIPALSFLFFIFSFSCISPIEEPTRQTVPELTQEIDSVEVELITLPEDFLVNDPKYAIMVLMNKASDVAIEGKFAPEGKRVSMIVSACNELREERFFSQQTPLVKIITQKDRNTDEEDYKALLGEITTAIYRMHESSAKERFGKPFKELGKEEQNKILEMIPAKIYQATAKQIMPPPPKK